jgi:Tol biopolymer transport system component
MTAFDRFDRFEGRLPDALEDLASPQFPDYFDDVLASAVAQRQRPAWTFLERWIPMSTIARRPALAPSLPWRTIGIALLLLALLVATAVVSVGLRQDNPAPPYGLAENGLVAFVSDGDIYTRDLTTGEEELIVGGEATDVFPFYSRDGLSLAFFRLGPANESEGSLSDEVTLMVAAADGSNARPVFGPAATDGAAWSPSSDSMAVVAKADGPRALFVVPTTAGEEARVIDVPVVPSGGVEWRPPDGGEIIFTGLDGGVNAVYGVRPDGSGFRQISGLGDGSPIWSPIELTPDGSTAVYGLGGSQGRIVVLDVETGDQRLFGAELPSPAEHDGGIEHLGSPTVLPDGETIVFGRYWNEQDGRINHQLWTASLAGDGADAVPIGEIHNSQGGHNPFWQAVAPDGEQILVVENDTFEAWLADPRGGQVEDVDLRELGDPPSWQRVAP